MLIPIDISPLILKGPIVIAFNDFFLEKAWQKNCTGAQDITTISTPTFCWGDATCFRSCRPDPRDKCMWAASLAGGFFFFLSCFLPGLTFTLSNFLRRKFSPWPLVLSHSSTKYAVVVPLRNNCGIGEKKEKQRKKNSPLCSIIIRSIHSNLTPNEPTEKKKREETTRSDASWLPRDGPIGQSE